MSGPSQATVLLDMLLSEWHIVQDADEFFAFRRGRQGVGQPFTRGHDRSSVKSWLLRAYMSSRGSVPKSSAVTDAIAAAVAFAEPIPDGRRVAQRVANLGDLVVYDLGHELVHIRPGGIDVMPTVPEGCWMVRSTKLALRQVRPVFGRDGLSAIRGLLNVDDDGWLLVTAWLVAALRSIETPALTLRGEQGTGKSTATKMLVRLTDPTTAETRRPPKSIDDLGVACARSYVVPFDNLSSISEQLSDAFCRIVTGDADVKRTLYTDADVTVMQYRRPLILNGISLGELRADLAERILPVELTSIPADDRLPLDELWKRFERFRAAALGDLLTLVERTLSYEQDHERPAQLTRMAEFHRLCWALDAVTDHGGYLDAYLAAIDTMTVESIEDSPVARAIVMWFGQHPDRDRLEGTSSHLLEVLGGTVAQSGRPHELPDTARGFAEGLRRAAPTLRAVGFETERRRDPASRSLRAFSVTRAAWD